jgi:penicillin-insensitive murein endopeptidase
VAGLLPWPAAATPVRPLGADADDRPPCAADAPPPLPTGASPPAPGEERAAPPPTSATPPEEAPEEPDDADPQDDVAEDEARLEEEGVAAVAPALPALDDAQLTDLLARDPASLGPLSVGRPNCGALLQAVRVPPHPRWTLLHPYASYATQETIDALARAIDSVRSRFPDTPPLLLGDFSDRDGGRLGRHLSHQSGRDVDTGWYYQRGHAEWYRPATRATLDLDRTWALVRALIIETDVEFLFIDRSVQRLLYQHALEQGEERAWLDRIFQHPGDRPGTPIRHATGHRTHIHVRFYNPVAQELGRRAYPWLIAHQKIRPETRYVSIPVKRGEGLWQFARRNGTTIRAVKSANRLRSNNLRIGQRLLVPRRGGVGQPPPLRLPPRRLPPVDLVAQQLATPALPDLVATLAQASPPPLAADPVVTAADPVVTATDPVVTATDPVVTAADPVVTAEAPVATAEAPVVTAADPGPTDPPPPEEAEPPSAEPAKPTATAAKTKSTKPTATAAKAKSTKPATAQAKAKPATAPAKAKPATTQAKAKTKPTPPRARTQTYTVRPGDCPWTIARRLGLPVETVSKAAARRPGQLQPGQKLVLPLRPHP